jgi:histidine triad (HIT) family protein
LKYSALPLYLNKKSFVNAVLIIQAKTNYSGGLILMGCIFCEIAEKKIPARIICEDDHALAFEDINPQAPLHALVIPKKHISTNLGIKEEDNALIGHLFQIANRIAKDRGIAERGFRLVMNCNPESGQTVFHIHLHILGGRLMHWPPG